MNFLFSKKYYIIFAFFLVIFILIFLYARTDITAHANIALEIRNNIRPVVIPFFYYFLLIIGTFFSDNIQYYYILSVLLLSILTFYRFYIVKKIYEEELLSISPSQNEKSKLVAWISAFLFIMVFSMPTTAVFDKGCFYLGTIPPNVWHNSTIILVFPFALLLFWLSVNQIYSFDNKRLISILGLVVLNVISKPSFLFAYVPAYTILLLSMFKLSNAFWKGMVPVFFSIICIGLSYFTLYVYKNRIDNNSVGISFFYLTKLWFSQDNIYKLIFFLIQEIFCSFFFPIVLLFRQKELFKNKMMFFAILLQIFSLIIYHTFIETGSRANHGNFGWQLIISNNILFFVCLLEMY